jgi:hypothetical protein
MKKLFTLIAVLMLVFMWTVPALAVSPGSPDTNAKYTLGTATKQWNTLYSNGASLIISEGATADAYETTISVTDPTADRTITIPNATGTVALTSGGVSSYTLDTDNVTLTAADCGEVHAIATDAKVYTLPSTVAGCVFTFINAGAAGAVLLSIDPAAADKVGGSCDAIDIAGADGEKFNNTKATSIKGDSATLIGDGVDGWYITACNGVWAEETP